MKAVLLRQYVLLILLLQLCGTKISAQSLKHYNDSAKTVVKTFYRGDSVLVGCDTVYLLNKPTFMIYKRFYDRGRSGSSSFKAVIAEYEEVIDAKDQMLSTKEAYYQQLRSQFDELSTKSASFMDRTSAGLMQVSTTLEKTTTSLIATQTLLEESRQMLIEERKKQNFKALKFGIGGVIAGGLISLLAVN